MRQILFRGKSKKTGEWIIGYYLKNRGVDFIAPDEFANEKTWEDYEVIPETVGQFTGLLDKNGKEIYEGDIILTPFLDPIFGDMVNGELCVKREVLFNKGSFVVKKDIGYVYLECFTKDNNAKVIGNIHDNPELLKTDTL